MEKTEWQMDLLKEAGTIGMGSACRAMSTLLGDQKVLVEVPNARLVNISEASWLWGDPEALVTAAYVPFVGVLSGCAVFGLPADTAELLMELVSRRAGVIANGSAFLEIANIVVTSYLNALAAITDCVLRPSVPLVAKGMAGAIIQSALALSQCIDDTLAVIDTAFSADQMGAAVTGRLILVPEGDSLEKFLAAVESAYAG
ncbi:MAG: chemotaxis protein CheC [Bacillota bacterium]